MFSRRISKRRWRSSIKKAELEGVSLPEEVRIYIATKTKSNVRELEGALIKLIAYSSITNSPVTLQMAQQVLKYLISGGERRITMDSILRCRWPRSSTCSPSN